MITINRSERQPQPTRSCHSSLERSSTRRSAAAPHSALVSTNRVKHAYFGSLSDASDDLRWKGQVDLAGRAISLDMTSDGAVTSAQLDAASAFPRALPRFDAAARAALALDSEGQQTVRIFMKHHLSVLPAATVESIFPTTPTSSITPELFVSRLVLKRVGLDPLNEDRTAIFDYTLDGNVTNYLVVVCFGADGEIASIDMES